MKAACLKPRGVSIACPNDFSIYNKGTADVNGCELSGQYCIYSKGTTTVTGTSISGTEVGIYVYSGTTTIGSGVSISGYITDGITNLFGMLTFKAIPALTKAANATCPDIFMIKGSKMTFATGSFTAPLSPISLSIVKTIMSDASPSVLPVTIATGYADNVTEDGRMIDPNRVFSWHKADDGYGFGLDGNGNVVMGNGVASVSTYKAGSDPTIANYTTLSDAFAAAQAGYVAGNGDNVGEFIPTVTLLADVTGLTSGYTIGHGLDDDYSDN